MNYYLIRTKSEELTTVEADSFELSYPNDVKFMVGTECVAFCTAPISVIKVEKSEPIPEKSNA